MIVDSSALLAVVMDEPESEVLLKKMLAAAPVGVGAATVVEVGIVLSRRFQKDASRFVERLIRELQLEVIPITADHAQAAIDAHVRYGKGRHSAALNYGDCLTYAVAKLAKQPLLFVGNDFTRTDLHRA